MNTNKQTGDTTMNESYKDKFNATMEQFGIDSLDDLKSNEEKKEFFKAVDIANNAVNEAFGPLNRRHTSARVFTDKNKAKQIMKFLSDNGEKYPVAINDNGSGQITIDDDGEKGSSFAAGQAIAKKFGVKVMGEGNINEVAPLVGAAVVAGVAATADYFVKKLFPTKKIKPNQPKPSIKTTGNPHEQVVEKIIPGQLARLKKEWEPLRKVDMSKRQKFIDQIKVKLKRLNPSSLSQIARADIFMVSDIAKEMLK